MIIKKLELVNFQVIKEFNADFEGNVYFITGDNELGKSTVLKAIGALLTGNRDAVLRNGEDKGFAKMVVGDDGEEYNVELRYTKQNPRGTLTIKQKSTGARSSNVSMLQQIFGYTDFDAVEFSRWSETAEGRRKQIEVVKSLLPEETRNRIAEIDASVAELKEQRTDVRRTYRSYVTIAESAEDKLELGDVDKYSEKKDVTALMEEQQAKARLIEKAKSIRAAHDQRVKQLAEIPDRQEAANREFMRAVDESKEELRKAELEYARIVRDAENMLQKAKEKQAAVYKEAETKCSQMLEAINEDRKDFTTRKENAEKWLEQYEASNPEKDNTAEQLQRAEEHNRKHALVLDYLTKTEQSKEYGKKVDEIEEKLGDLMVERGELIANSELPISGLSFGEDGLVLNDVPFAPGKVSDSQIMEVAAKLIIASNPTVKVFRIARGESLGGKRLKAIIDIAKRNGFQGFIEEVHRGQDDLIVEEYSEK